jgi:hypothetical protein
VNIESHRETDEPLPATFAFVLGLGGAIVVGWFAMFVLLCWRW